MLIKPLFKYFRQKSERSGGTSVSTDPKTLFDLLTGQRARIVRIYPGGPQGIRQRLLDMGITKGEQIRVERHAPLGDPVEITVKGYYLALRMSEAKEIEVEEI